MHVKVFRQTTNENDDSFIHALVDRVVAGWNEASVRRTPAEGMGGGIIGPMTFFFPATLFVVLLICTLGNARMKVLIWFLLGAAGPISLRRT